MTLRFRIKFQIWYKGMIHCYFTVSRLVNVILEDNLGLILVTYLRLSQQTNNQISSKSLSEPKIEKVARLASLAVHEGSSESIFELELLIQSYVYS